MSKQITFTVGSLLDDMARRYPDNEALVYPERNLRLTYKQFNDTCRQIAKGLLRLGIKKGDNIAIWAYNVPEWVLLQFASAKIGAILVTVNTSYKSAELEYILGQSDSTSLFMVGSFKDTNYVETLAGVVPELASSQPGTLDCSKLPFLKNVIFIGTDTPAGMINFDSISPSAGMSPTRCSRQ
ncbi:MAG: AMP-binding protein [Pelobacteraceae bacterium]